MKSSEIEIMKTFLCTMDESLPYPNYNEIKINDEDTIYGYIQKLVSSAMTNTAAKRAEYGEDDYLASVVTTDPNDLEMFVNVTTEVIYDLVKNNARMYSGSGIFAFCIYDDQCYVAFFKINFQERFICTVSEEGRVAWILNSKVMPKPAQKDYEFFLINASDRRVTLSDCEYEIDDCKINYLAERVLQLKTKASEKEKVEIIEDTTIETIREYYPQEEIPQKIMEYRTEVAEHVEQTGSVSVAKIEEAVFSDNEEAAVTYREKLEQERVEREPMPVSKKTERRFMKKQKIVTDNGIELLVPVEYLKNQDYLEYIQDESGNITIVLKEIRAINA